MQFDLVFEGGGAKGSAFVGAMQEFEARGHTARRFVGTSAGAITATLMAAGYSSSEMLTAVNERLPNGKIRFSSFMDVPARFDPEAISNSLTYALFKKVDIPWIPERIEAKIDEVVLDQLMKMEVYRELFSFVERGGMYAGDKFLEWIREKLNAKYTDLPDLVDATLAQFNIKTGADVSVIASDTEGQEMLVLNHRTAPDCPVAWAVRMSMSIPFIWQEVR
ncbi:MAG: patatin-like phospholipase family protein, partial [Nitrospira sp.]|nr:patatin-like phospholipase family protein [Nitrospira sp.]